MQDELKSEKTAPIPMAKAAPPTPPAVRRSKTSYTAVYVGLIFLCMAGCLGIVTVLVHNHFLGNESPDSITSTEIEIDNEEETDRVADEVTVIDVTKPETLFTDEQHSDIAATLAPHVVQVRATSPAGITDCVGLLIDSRGWIATSRQALIGATQVDVFVDASRKIDSEAIADSIASIGTLLEVRNQSLAVIAIDVDAVSAVRDVELSSDDFPGVGNELAMIGWSDGKPAWATDCIVISESKPSASVDDPDGGLAPQLVLTSHGSTANLAGAPICRVDGAVAGVYVDATESGRGVMLPVKYLRDALESIDGPPTPVRRFNCRYDTE